MQLFVMSEDKKEWAPLDQGLSVVAAAGYDKNNLNCGDYLMFVGKRQECLELMHDILQWREGKYAYYAMHPGAKWTMPLNGNDTYYIGGKDE